MKRLIISLSIVCFSIVVAAQTLSTSAPNVVTLDETFRVAFTSDGSISDFSWEPGSDFEVVWGPQHGSSTSTQIINGKRTSSHTESYTYLLQAKSTGKFTIPGATAKVEKKDVSSLPVSIEVVEGEADNSSSQQQAQPQSSSQSQTSGDSESISNKNLYLKLLLNKSSVVKGEPVIATLKLYTRVDISSIEDIKLPTFNGFWTKEIDAIQQIEFNRENVDGQIYNVAVISKYMLIPQQTGTLTIEPVEMVALAMVNVRSSGFMGLFGDSYQIVRKRLATPQVKINVKALPSGAPESFAGGVGEFKMNAELSNDSMKSNEASSLTVTFTGKGNISMLEAPKVNFPPDFEVYDIKTSEDISADGTSGTKRFEYPFIPRSHGSFKIEPIEYSYYDINAGKYVTLTSGELPIEIEKGEDVDNGGVVMNGISRQSVKNLAEDVRYIARGSGKFHRSGQFFSCSIPFFIIAAFIIVLFFVVDWMLKKADAMRKDVVGTKNRKANKLARARLQQAAVYKSRNLSTAYYEELHKALLGYISDKLSIPVADLSKDYISEKLQEKGVAQSVTDSFIAILDECEYARYAPNADVNAMENQYNNAVSIISDIESSMKSSTSRKGSKAIAVIALLTLGIMNVNAQNQDKLWNDANEAYALASYQQALSSYQMIESSGFVSSDLFYNMGNAWFKLGDNAHAILYFEKALKYNPGNVDARHNLEIARQFTMDKIEEIPDFILVSWVKDIKYLLSADGWAWVTLALMIVAAAMFLMFRHLKSSNKLTFILGSVALLFVVVSLLFSISERRDMMTVDSAIVMQPVTTVMSSPGDDGKTLFMLHEGTKVSIMDNLGQWTQVELSDGRQGWVMASEIEGI